VPTPRWSIALLGHPVRVHGVSVKNTPSPPHPCARLLLGGLALAACDPQGVTPKFTPDAFQVVIDLDALPDAAPLPDALRADAFLEFLDSGVPIVTPDAAVLPPVPDAGEGPPCTEPVIEACNGLDDDCDHRVDEGRIIGNTCYPRTANCLQETQRICDTEANVICPARENLTCRMDPLVFAAVSDYGGGNRAEGLTTDLIRGFSPSFVLTAGDNNYPRGEAETIDRNVGQFFGVFIGGYRGAFGNGPDDNRFWPALGDADWLTAQGQPYLDFFTLPGNERYYDVDLGVVHVFVLDSDAREPDGNTWESVQGQWFQAAAARSTACAKIAIFHHPPYSSSWRGEENGGVPMRWPFAMAGMTAVISGQDRIYERLQIDDIPYFIIGAGGGAQNHTFAETPRPESQVRYRDRPGAMKIVATQTDVTFSFVNIESTLVDSITVPLRCPM
jgi:hypothetical protein